MSDNGRKASVVYEGNGSQTIFLFPFDYLRKAFIYAQDIQNDNVKDLVQGVDFEVDNNRHIHLHTALKAGHILRLYRKTTTKPLVDWQDASVLRSADLTLQEVQLLHLAEETSDKVVDSAGLSVDPINTNLWNANFKRIGNVLDPVEPQDVVTLNYIQANKDGMINQIKATGQNEIQDITNTSNHVLTNIKDTGNSYIKTQTSLKDTTNTYANTALTYKNQAGTYKDIAQKWAESNGSPDNVADDVSDTGRTKSSRSWAMAAKTLYTQIKSKMEQLSSTLQQALSTLSDVKAQQSQIKTDMFYVEAAKTEATTQANKSREYATEALNSASAAKQSAKEAKTFDPTKYSTTEEVDNKVNAVDGKVNECEKKQTLKKINATVNTDFVSEFSCYQIGHAVQVSISLKKIQLGNTITLVSGLPKPPCALVFEESIHGNQGKTVRMSLWDNGTLKLWYLDDAELGVGKEFQTFFTYLTED